MEHMTEITARSLLSLFETDKSQRITFAQSVVNAIEEGHADPIKIHMQLKCTEDIIKQVTENKSYKSLLLTEANKRGKSFDTYNAKFETKEVGTKYDYTVCEDETYNNLVAEMETLKEKIKAREKFLQNIPDGGIADAENGNMIYRASKTSTTSVSVTLK